MTALNDRRLWLAHLHECTQCPANRCHQGDELAAAVRDSMTPGEFWQGVYAPKVTGHDPAA
jgi:hypothetical protein